MYIVHYRWGFDTNTYITVYLEISSIRNIRLLISQFHRQTTKLSKKEEIDLIVKKLEYVLTIPVILVKGSHEIFSP